MSAYFSFYNNDNCDSERSSLDERFKTARDIVEKYENCSILNFRNAFKKIQEQLDELDSGHSAITNEQIEVDQSEEISEE